MTTENTAIESSTPAMDALTAKFLAEVQAKGLATVLEWIDGWYPKVAEARQADYHELHKFGGRYPEEFQVSIAQRLMQSASSSMNSSSLVGTNLMRQAEIQVLAATLRGSSVAIGLSKRRAELEDNPSAAMSAVNSADAG